MMLIKELKLTKILKTDDDAISPYSNGLKDILDRNGWEILGHGQEAIVAEHPNKSYVLKLFLSESKYIKFVEHVKDNQNNPHYPKFSRYVKTVPGTQYSYVRMEKLSRTTTGDLLMNYFSELCALYAEGKRQQIRSLGYDLWTTYIPDAIEGTYNINVKQGADPNSVMNAIKDITKDVDKSWLEVCYDTVDLAKELRLNWLDLHDKNFMKRGSTLIVADPFYD